MFGMWHATKLKETAITEKIEHYGKLCELRDLQELVLQRSNDHRDLCRLHHQLPDGGEKFNTKNAAQTPKVQARSMLTQCTPTSEKMVVGGWDNWDMDGGAVRSVAEVNAKDKRELHTRHTEHPPICRAARCHTPQQLTGSNQDSEGSSTMTTTKPKSLIGSKNIIKTTKQKARVLGCRD